LVYERASEKIAHKNLSVYCTFPFESAGFFQSIEFSMQRTWKEASLHLKLALILLYIILSKENV
jgi:hypothetical protein